MKGNVGKIIFLSDIFLNLVPFNPQLSAFLNLLWGISLLWKIRLPYLTLKDSKYQMLILGIRFFHIV